MTDPEFADRTYIEPITAECVEKIIARELEEMKRLGVPANESQTPSNQSSVTHHASRITHHISPHKLVLLPTLGGQTPLNTAMALHRRGPLEKYGVEMIGANAQAIPPGEDHQTFTDPIISIGPDRPPTAPAHPL